MLDACAELIDEVGYEGITTTLIAERATVAVGSLYQFFPDKKAVVQALTLRNLEYYLSRVDERIKAADPRSWWETVDTMIDLYLEMHRELPGFQSVHFGDIIDPHLMHEDKNSNTLISEGVAQALNQQFGLPYDDIILPVQLATDSVDAGLKLAFRRDPGGDEKTIAEVKDMVRLYLSNRFDANNVAR